MGQKREISLDRAQKDEFFTALQRGKLGFLSFENLYDAFDAMQPSFALFTVTIKASFFTTNKQHQILPYISDLNIQTSIIKIK